MLNILSRLNKKCASYSGAVFAFAALGLFLCAARAEAQVEPPNRKHLYSEDFKNTKKAKRRAAAQASKGAKPQSDDLKFEAPSVAFDKESNVFKGSGGVIIARAGTQVQADSAEVNMTSKDSTLSGGVVFSAPGGTLSSDSASFNIDSETGSFNKAQLELDEGDYEISADKVEKVSETRYRLFGSKLTTCGCGEGNLPWSISGRKTKLTQEGYAQVYDAKLNFFGVPVFYSPYFALPLKLERQSGLLVPSFGYSNRSGFEYAQPIFAVIDDTADIKLTPFIQSKTRFGTTAELRKVFSTRSSLDSMVLFSNEGARDGSLQGTDTTGYYDPTFDENRFAWRHMQSWRSERSSPVASSFIADIYYVSDDLMPRELDYLLAGDPSATYTTSTVALRNEFGSYLSTELFAEYNQALLDNDDYVFQRLPEFRANASRSFRAFGSNPYGLKLQAGLSGDVTEFARKEGYEGMRADMMPTLSLPFHYKNYLQSKTSLAFRGTKYNLSETLDPDTNQDLSDSNSRSIFQFSEGLSTTLERVYELSPESALSRLSRYGAENRGLSLARVKHMVEPTLSYTYVPDRNQEDLPFFDASDRIRRKSYLAYGFKTSLLGRFRRLDAGAAPIEELTPEVEDMPTLSPSASAPAFGDSTALGMAAAAAPMRGGELRELMNLYVRQIYDLNQEIEDQSGALHSLSDIGIGTGIFPSKYFAFSFDGDYNPYNNDFSSWGTAAHFRDDRGDIFRARYSFIDATISQIEGSAELPIEDRLNFGYYARYDGRDSKFMEQRIGLRFWNVCRCWHFDVGYHQRINPDTRNVLFSVTLGGLGDFGQAVNVDSRQ